MNAQDKLADVLAQIAKGTCSMWSAKNQMGEDLTPEIESVLRTATDKMMEDVCAHQDRMDRVMARSY
jgi:hypothetical protein